MAKALTTSYAQQQLLRLNMSPTNAHKASLQIKVTTFAENSLILSRGAVAKNWYFIINGMVSAWLKTDKENNSSVVLYGPGTWFSEHSIIAQKPSFWNYSAVEECDCLVFRSENVIQIAKNDIGFSSFLLELVAWRSHYAAEMLTLMKSGSPALRVVMGISQFVEVLAYRAQRPPTIGYGESLRIPVKQSIVANMCGVSRSVFSELIQHLYKGRLISIAYGMLEISNVAAWTTFAAKKRSESTVNLQASIQELIDEFVVIPEREM
jgi:CRP/FNR family cyclic AMP-dependent transcriptional regulator